MAADRVARRSPLEVQTAPAADRARIALERRGDALVVLGSGQWRLAEGLPSTSEFLRELDGPPVPTTVRVEVDPDVRWDTGLVVVVDRIEAACHERGIGFDASRLPSRLAGMLELLHESPPRSFEGAGLGSQAGQPDLLEGTGKIALAGARAVGDMLEFLGSTTIALLRLRSRRSGTAGESLFRELRAAAGTLGVLAPIALLSGGVLSLLAIQQLEKMGASLLAPHLVAIVIFRELGALASGMALAGRFGAGYAGELAAMSTGGEVEAMRAVGVDPVEFLVTRRVVALALTGPLLVIYANAFGLLGGAIVGVGLMDVTVADYTDGTRRALTLTHALAGLLKGAIFGLVVGLTGCYHGLRASTRSQVGLAIRAGVVFSILGVVAADAALTLLFKWVRL
jgi:phospholipid/cholesterol/gamma-HCH transport system permease protein